MKDPDFLKIFGLLQKVIVSALVVLVLALGAFLLVSARPDLFEPAPAEEASPDPALIQASEHRLKGFGNVFVGRWNPQVVRTQSSNSVHGSLAQEKPGRGSTAPGEMHVPAAIGPQPVFVWFTHDELVVAEAVDMAVPSPKSLQSKHKGGPQDSLSCTAEFGGLEQHAPSSEQSSLVKHGS